MGRIVTFYSYKGGVGRSMALANVALLLAQRGLRVLAVDWDLEAPGLDRYFGAFQQQTVGAGLLPMFMEVCEGAGPVDYRAYCTVLQADEAAVITLLTSGREQDPDYSRKLERFDWDGFFGRHAGGAFVEELRARWRADFDVVLIDSRTGLSDTGGICTIQLPDVVVAMFTANFQSVYGVRDVMRLAQLARQRLAYDRMPLTVLPLPARWGMQEFQETQVWLDRIAEVTQEFFDDWLPRPLTGRDVLERLRVPQRDFFGFGERLAVVEQGTGDPTGLGFVYDRVASILADDFAEIPRTLGVDTARTRGPDAEAKGARAARAVASAASTHDDYQYDLFFSFERSSAEWAAGLAEYLGPLLSKALGRPVAIFSDIREIQVGEAWKQTLGEALARSRVMVALLTPRYASSPYAMREFEVFSNRAAIGRRPIIMPVLLQRGRYPRVIDEWQSFDLTGAPVPPPRFSSPGVDQKLAELTDRLVQMIDHAPPFDPAEAFRVKAVWKTAPRRE